LDQLISWYCFLKCHRYWPFCGEEGATVTWFGKIGKVSVASDEKKKQTKKTPNQKTTHQQKTSNLEHFGMH